jgi:hypothetical protein
MTWWSDASIYIRSADDLRVLADAIRTYCSSAIDRQIYPIVTDDPREVRDPYTFDHNRRPAIVAILIALIDTSSDIASQESDSIAKQHPYSANLAAEIAERKEPAKHLDDASKSFVWMLSIILRALYQDKKQNNRVVLSPKVQLRIRLFAETLIRAAQLYRETLERNRILWDPTEPKYINAREFNFAFDIGYVKLAIDDLATKNNTSIETHNGTYDDLPTLIYDTVPTKKHVDNSW